MTGASVEAPLVLVLDDEAPVRTALDSLLRSVGFRVACFAAPEELLHGDQLASASCLVLDIRLQMTSGFDVQAQLAEAGLGIPIVFMTGHGDIPMSVRAMKAGAVDFLTKPFREQDMIDAVIAALDRDAKRLATERQLTGMRDDWMSLTPREREVMRHVAAGLMNKQIAAEMGIAEITAKMHRGQAMRKMHVRSVAQLVRRMEALGVIQGLH